MINAEQSPGYFFEPVARREELPAMSEADSGARGLAMDLSKSKDGKTYVWLRTEDGQWSEDSALFASSSCCQCGR